MITRHSTLYEKGRKVFPRVRVSAGKVVLLDLEYEWDGMPGVVPSLSMDLSSDLACEKVYMAAVYQNAEGERRVVLDSAVIDSSVGPAERMGQSADSVMEAGGWKRLFMIFQVVVPPAVMGLVEDENAVVQVFEADSRS